MSQEDQQWNPVKGLTVDEISVECVVRNIDFSSSNWEQTLRKAFTSEREQPFLKPSHTHTTDYKQELNFCQNQVSIITKILQDERITNSESLSDLKARIRHWKDRTYRLKGCFHQDNDVDRLINQWRRLEQLYNVCMEKINELPPDIQKSTTDQAVSSVGDSLTDLKLFEKQSDTFVTEFLPSTVHQADTLVPTSNSLLVTSPHEATNVTWSRRAKSSESAASAMPMSFPKLSANRNALNRHCHYGSNTSRMVPNSSIDFPDRSMPISPNKPTNRNYYNYVPPPVQAATNYLNPPTSGPHSFNIPYAAKSEPKWNISFSGTPHGLAVQDFVFRLESFAWREQVPVAQLYVIMPRFLKDVAEKWYWVFSQKFPNATYIQLRQSLIQRFSSIESDRATRRFIETRKQRNTESISDFILEIESLNNRLSRPFPELDLLEIIRENMSYDLQQMTLHLVIASIEELRLIGHRYERLWDRRRRDRSPPADRRTRYINELISPTQHSSYDLNHTFPDYDLKHDREQWLNEDLSCHVESMSNTIVKPPTVNPSINTSKQLLVCWNCRLLEHRYQDCNLPPQGIFCYGCGAKNVIKPQCAYCQRIAENYYPGVNRTGGSRPVRIMTRPQQANALPDRNVSVAPNTKPPQFR